MESPPHQQRVQALFGRCLLRLQQYELLMKRLLANQAVTSSASGVVPTDPKLAQDIVTSTLGLPKVLVQDWFKDNQTQRQVRSEIERVLDEDLPVTYERALFKQKCDNVFDLVVDYASRGRKWAA